MPSAKPRRKELKMKIGVFAIITKSQMARFMIKIFDGVRSDFALQEQKSQRSLWIMQIQQITRKTPKWQDRCQWAIKRWRRCRAEQGDSGGWLRALGSWANVRGSVWGLRGRRSSREVSSHGSPPLEPRLVHSKNCREAPCLTNFELYHFSLLLMLFPAVFGTPGWLMIRPTDRVSLYIGGRRLI